MPIRLLLVVIIAFALGSLGAVFLRPGDYSAMQTGRALIGGAFSLVNQDGKRMTDQDFHGKFMLVSFGYTSCPDVCPAELSAMANTMDKLGDKAGQVTPVFITIDPERDTVEQVSAYVKNFHASMVGLTGTPEEIKQAARAFRVYYAKADDKNSALGYLMDHSAFIYLMNPKGEYVTHFAYGTPPEKMSSVIAKAIEGGAG